MGNILHHREIRANHFEQIEDLAWSINPTPEAYALCFSEMMADGKYNMGRVYTWFNFSRIMRGQIPREKQPSFDLHALLHWRKMYEHMPQYKKELIAVRDAWQEYIWS